MVCNLVTYRARSAVREVGYALGFPRPLVDRVAKALETYDSVMVRRDLEAEGGFAEFFRRTGEGLPGEALAAEQAEARGLVDGMGQLQQRVPLVGKVPPWRQPPTPEDPNAPRPFAWLRARRHEAEAEPFRDDPLAPVTHDPAGRPVRRRGRPGRHPGERGLAAGRPRHGLRPGHAPAARAGRPGARHAAAAAAQDRPTRAPQHVGPAAGHARPQQLRGPGRGRPAAARPAAVPRSGCRTGSAGSSSAPASTASRATCRSTPAACS